MIKHASGLSPEELSLQDAAIEGRKAGALGNGASMNPYQAGIAEHAEWERHRVLGLGALLAYPRRAA